MTTPLQDPGVQGLAQLGRNAIERVRELEAELAAAVAERDRLRNDLADALDVRSGMSGVPTALAAVMAERDQLRARLAAIDNAPTVAVISVDAMGVSCQMAFPNSQSRTKTTAIELIARPAKDQT